MHDIEKELQKRFSNIPKADNYYKSIDTSMSLMY